jgi:hypothetical protein
VFAKNHRNATVTAEELGIKKIAVQRDTKLKPGKKKLRLVVKKSTNSKSSEGSEGARETGSVEAKGSEDGKTEKHTEDGVEHKETEHEEDTNIRRSKEADTETEPSETESELDNRKHTSEAGKEVETKNTKTTTKQDGDTTIIVNSAGKERVAKVIDWK